MNKILLEYKNGIYKSEVFQNESKKITYNLQVMKGYFIIDRSVEKKLKKKL